MLQDFTKTAKGKGILWLLFAVTATISAFFLPAFIFWTLGPWQFLENLPSIYLPDIITVPSTIIIIFSALYFSLYRVKTIFTDLGLAHIEKIVTLVFISIILLLIGYVAFFALLASLAGHGS